MSKKYKLIQNGVWQILKDEEPFLFLRNETRMANIKKTLDTLNADAKMRDDRAKAGRVKSPNKGKNGGAKLQNSPECPYCGKHFNTKELKNAADTKFGKAHAKCVELRDGAK